jgi:DNA-binding transcriptional LysR family regulator
MDRLDAMHMFVRVVETGSFTKVAQEFATTQPTVTKQVAAMEARLKVRLLNRNTRGVSLTEAGALYYEKCKIIVSDVAEAENVVKVRQTQVQGQLRIGSSVAFGRRVLIPLAMDFMKHNPQVQVDLSFEDRYTDLVANGIDVALRLGKLADSSLGARMLGVNPWVLVASPTYLRKHGTPRRPSDLKEHSTLIYSSVQGNDIWRLRNASGEPVSIPVTAAALQQSLGPAGRGPLAHGHCRPAALRGPGLAQGRPRGGSAQDLPPARAGNPRRLPLAAPGAAEGAVLHRLFRASSTMPGGRICQEGLPLRRFAPSPLCTRCALTEGTAPSPRGGTCSEHWDG